jgi:hypothetical protein
MRPNGMTPHEGRVNAERRVKEVAALGVKLGEYLEAQQAMPDDGYVPMLNELKSIMEES